MWRFPAVDEHVPFQFFSFTKQISTFCTFAYFLPIGWSCASSGVLVDQMTSHILSKYGSSLHYGGWLGAVSGFQLDQMNLGILHNCIVYNCMPFWCGLHNFICRFLCWRSCGRKKHCQRHNGPEGWVHLAKVTSRGHITSSNTNHITFYLQNLD